MFVIIFSFSLLYHLARENRIGQNLSKNSLSSNLPVSRKEVVEKFKLLTELSFISLFVTLRALAVCCVTQVILLVLWGKELGMNLTQKVFPLHVLCPSCRVGDLAGSAVHGPGHRNAFFFAVHLKPGARGS